MPTAAAKGPLGPIVRLQVQRSPLKPGVAPHREYDPSPITPVPAIQVDRDGVTGLTSEGPLLDVHHPAHPATRHRRGANAISVLTTADYRVLRDRFGPHLVDGIAGETVLVESSTHAADLVGHDIVLTAGGPPGLRLTHVAAAPPCVEFTRFCLGRPAGSPVDDELRDTLAWLGGGRRGVYAVIVGSAASLGLGTAVAVS